MTAISKGYKQTKIGVIPEDWGCLPARNYFSKRIAKGYDGLEIYSVTINKSWQRRSDLNRETGSDVALDKSLLAEKGDLVYNTMRMWQGALGMAENTGVVSPAYIVIRPKPMMNSQFAFYMLKSYTYLHYLTAYSYGLTSDRLRLYFKDFGMIPFICPPLKEQEKIVQILTTWDDAISKQEELIKAKEQQKKGLMHKLLSGEVRFDGFDDEWEEVRLSHISIKKSSNIAANAIEQNHGKYLIYGASGILKKIDFFTEKEPYISIVKDGAGVGKVLLCQAYSSVLGTIDIIKPKEKTLLCFLYYLLQITHFTKFTTGSTIPHIYYKDYSIEKLKLPSLPEQQKIGGFLSFVDNEINTLKKELLSFKQQKKGLMQKLLTGEVRVKT